MISPVWEENGRVFLLDQTRLPLDEEILEIHTPEEMAGAISRLQVRGAPAIGIAGAFGVYLAARGAEYKNAADYKIKIKAAGEILSSARPTAVNLSWAVSRALSRLDLLPPGAGKKEILEGLLFEAQKIQQEDIAAGRAIGEHGCKLLKDCKAILTHCNAGALATGGAGTALAPIYALYSRGLRPKIYASETRPLLQGARLTAWELKRSGADVTLLCDNMAGSLMQSGKLDAVIVGADRIAKNGDTANKIGTYSLAVLADYHKIPFYVAAPLSTIDFSLDSGKEIPIEERCGTEITSLGGVRTAPDGVLTFNPAFDVTPFSLITAILTEKGVFDPCTLQTLNA